MGKNAKTHLANQFPIHPLYTLQRGKRGETSHKKRKFQEEQTK